MKTTKKCTICKIAKELKFFNKNKSKLYGYGTECKQCRVIQDRKYRRTKNGLISQIYSHQKTKSKKRKHNPPTYTKNELKHWLFSQSLFHDLYNMWVLSEYDTNLIPSIDRKKDNIGYTMDNIQLMTWGENNSKGYQDMRNSDLIHGVKPQKAVIQYDLNNNFIEEYCSGSQAERILNIHQTKISNVCNGKRKTAGGYKWKFREEQA